MIRSCLKLAKISPSRDKQRQGQVETEPQNGVEMGDLYNESKSGAGSVTKLNSKDKSFRVRYPSSKGFLLVNQSG